MADIVDSATRSRMMSRIRGKDTKPELILRRLLHAMGLRYRLHVKNLPGKPDLVFPRFRAIVFVHGCFWHGHEACPYFRLPATRRRFWQEKIEGNRARDAKAERLLRESGWRVLTIWECALRDASPEDRAAVARRAANWLKSGRKAGNIDGKRGAGKHEKRIPV